MLRKGQRVLVWSLQSFHGGGFLEGEPAFVRQDSSGSSVILCVVRKKGSSLQIDESYEVYTKQIEVVDKCNWLASKALRHYRKRVMNDPCIDQEMPLETRNPYIV